MAAVAPLLKWVGSKQRAADQIVRHFPGRFGTYFEPFLGSGALLGRLAPARAIASDVLGPLIELWQTLASDPETVKRWYAERWQEMAMGDRAAAYLAVRDRYNAQPNAADFLFVSRSCYGGVIRFRKLDGHISTPCGIHRPISPESFAARVDTWHRRIRGTRFVRADYREVLEAAKPGDLVYCDPPYSDSQAILYGAQAFRLGDLWVEIERLRRRGVRVALSLDGMKRSGGKDCRITVPDGLFDRELLVDCGRSMLLRFKRQGESLESERVQDRLLLTWA